MGSSRTFLPGNTNNEADHTVHETGTVAEPVHIAAGSNQHLLQVMFAARAR